MRIILVLIMALWAPIAVAKAKPTQKSLGDVIVDLNIPLGRIEIFGEQERSALTSLSEAMADEDLDPDLIYFRIFRAVWAHNHNVTEACRAKLIDPGICRRGLYRPRWLVTPGARRFTLWRLSRMADEAQGAMMPFWSAVCAKAGEKQTAKDKEKGEPICPME